ncbi:MAG: class I SAM-dependent methyltransferase [Lachnospiraceae bacterium]|nr:class I SAM-dependent methyltransferase [Lachnospiraceae bacterium]
MKETEWDKKLKIQTTGHDDYRADQYHFPYEPTPYSVLERLVESGYINAKNILVDYGCGKGRVGFYLNYIIGCNTIGIECDKRICDVAWQNQKTYAGKKNVEILCMNAEAYEIENADCFYFFNPFSIEILRSVIGQIMTSYYEKPRQIRLFFYYPNDEYVAYLMSAQDLTYIDEIDCRDLFDGNNERERIMVFEVSFCKQMKND